MKTKRNIKREYDLSGTLMRRISDGIDHLMCLLTGLLIFPLMGCSDFVEVDLPQDQLTSETVFNSSSTATSAIRNIYAEMRDGFFAGSPIINDLGLYTDELDPSGLSDFHSHTITADNPTILTWWNDAYNLIYAANSVIEGIDNSKTLPLKDRRQLSGEALFTRAYIYSLLVEVFGPVPYITGTDYIANAKVSRTPVDEVYIKIISDLKEASSVLGDDISEDIQDPGIKHIRPSRKVVESLMARVYLYTEQWGLAEEMASNVIGSFVLETDLSKVFLNKSPGTIWQFKSGLEGENTSEGTAFIFNGNPGTRPTLTTSLVEDAFEPNDLRRGNWIREINGTETWYHAYKYKESTSTPPDSQEYSIVFRLAEQYLIRAEARAQLGDISGAQQDLNAVRNRAGLPDTTAGSTSTLLEAILRERRVELFLERGHRWFDLKRTGRAAEILSPIKPSWRDTNVLFPIPEQEILLNPNLLPQNEGYN